MIKKLLLSLTVLLGLLIGAGYWAITTETGLQLLYRGLNLLPLHLKITGLHGNLLRQGGFDRFVLNVDDVAIIITDAEWTLAAKPWLNHHVQITNLNVDELIVNDTSGVSSNNVTASNDFSTLPIALTIQRGKIAKLIIRRNHEPLVASKQITFKGTPLRSNASMLLTAEELAIATTNRHAVDLQAIKLTWNSGLTDYTVTAQGKLINSGIDDLTQVPTDFNLQAHGNVYQDVKISSLTLTDHQQQLSGSGQLNYLNNLIWQTQLTVSNFNIANILKNLSSTLSGTVRSTGQWGSQQLQFTVDFEQVTGQFNQLPLAAQGQLSFMTNDYQLKNIKLSLGKNNLSADGKLGAHNILHWSANLSALQQLLPSLHGTLITEGTLAGSLTQPILQTTIAARDLRYQTIAVKQLQTTLAFDTRAVSQCILQANQLITPAGTLAKLVINGSGTLQAPSFTVVLNNQPITVTTEFKQFNYLNWQAPLTAAIHLETKQLNFMRTWIPIVEKLQGVLQSDLTVTGSLARPSIASRIFSNEIIITQNHSNNLHVTPDLTLNYQANDLAIAGKIIIPQANIALPEFNKPDSASADIVYVNTKPSDPNTTLHINSDINLTFGDNVQIKGSGLTGRLSGAINIKQNQSLPATASGRLTINNGQYQAYGQTLKLNVGQLTYIDELITNPSLNIEASKTIHVATGTQAGANLHGLANNPQQAVTSSTLFDGEQLLVGIKIQGPLKAPVITLFSRPAGMSQADILSMLVLGRPTNQANAAGIGTLFAAAQAIGLGKNQTNDIKDQVKQTLGLDVVTVSSQQTLDQKSGGIQQSTALVLGKYLSPKLYIDYSAGLVNQNSAVNITYFLNKNWSLKTQASTTDSGADLLYSLSTK